MTEAEMESIRSTASSLMSLGSGSEKFAFEVCAVTSRVILALKPHPNGILPTYVSDEGAWSAFKVSGLLDFFKHTRARLDEGHVSFGPGDVLEAFGCVRRFWSLCLRQEEGRIEPESNHQSLDEIEALDSSSLSLRELASRLSKRFPLPQTFQEWEREQYVDIVALMVGGAAHCMRCYEKAGDQRRVDDLRTLLDGEDLAKSIKRALALSTRHADSSLDGNELEELFTFSLKFSSELTAIDTVG